MRGSEVAAPRLPVVADSDGVPLPPRVVRLPADWWDSPPVVACSFRGGPRSATTARRLTQDTLNAWELPSLAEDAAMIVAELVANAVTHGALCSAGCEADGTGLGLRLRRRAGEVICAVLDPSDEVPMPRAAGGAEDSGRGLQIVDALSDLWGWSPIADRGKAVWAVLFVPGDQDDEA